MSKCQKCERAVEYIEKIVSQSVALDVELENCYTIRGSFRCFWIGVKRWFKDVFKG
jgi:hypothetical protein